MTERWIWQGGPDDPPVLEWLGVRFPAGVPVDVDHPHILAKAPGNPYFMRAPDDNAVSGDKTPDQGPSHKKSGRVKRSPETQ